MNWLLSVVFIVFICFIAVGYHKGLVKVLFSLAASILALLLVGVISPYVGNFLREHTDMHDWVQKKSSDMVAEWNQSRDLSTEEARFAAIEEYEIPDFLKTYLKDNHTLETMEQEFNEYISRNIADLAISAASFVLSFLAILLLLYIISLILNLVTKLPVIRTLNHAGGAIAGAVEGLLILWIFFLVITFLCTTEFGKTCMRMIGSSQILSWLYDKNPLMKIFV